MNRYLQYNGIQICAVVILIRISDKIKSRLCPKQIKYAIVCLERYRIVPVIEFQICVLNFFNKTQSGRCFLSLILEDKKE